MAHRIRKNHKPIFATLHLFEQIGNKDPIPSPLLAKLVRIHLTETLDTRSFNRTNRTLVKNGLLTRVRCEESGKVKFNLTDTSRAIAEQCFVDVHKMSSLEYIQSNM